MSRVSGSIRAVWVMCALGLRIPAGVVAADVGSALSPKGVVVLALAHSPAIAAASASRTEASLSAKLAAAALHPEASLSTTPGYSAGVPGGIGGRLPAIATVDVRQTAYDSAREAAVLEAQAQRILQAPELDVAKQEVARTALAAYAKCWLDSALVSDAITREEASTAGRTRAEALEREGRVTTIDVERAALREAEARQVRLDRESDRDLDEWELRQLVGWPPTAAIVLAVDPLDAIPVAMDGDNLTIAHRNDVAMTSLSEAMARFDKLERVRRRWWIPVLDLDAQYSRLMRTASYDEFYRTFKADDWSVGVSVSLPLWTGGRTEAAAARTHAEAERLDEQHRARMEQVDLLVRRGESLLARAVSGLSLRKRAEGLAEEDLHLARTLAGEARLGPAELEAKETALADARDARARAQLDLASARVAMLAVRGELLPTLLASVAAGAGATASTER